MVPKIYFLCSESFKTGLAEYSRDIFTCLTVEENEDGFGILGEKEKLILYE